MKETDEVLQLDDITIRYGKRNACEHVSFQVRRGEVFALLGRNGSGKTSLIRCLLGQLRPHSGRACLFGTDVWSHRHRLLAKVGVVPEEPDAPPDMTAIHLGEFCAGLYPVWDGTAFRGCLDRSGIPTNTAFRSLSRGQKGTLHLALALAHHPELLVLDDPTLGLDAVARAAVLEGLVTDLADRATTVLIATHDLSGIEGIADRVGILDAGLLQLDLSIENLKSRYARLRYLDLNPAMEDAARLELAQFTVVDVFEKDGNVEAVVSDYDESKFLAFCKSPSVSGPEFFPMSLEEIVIAVTGPQSGGMQ